MLGLPDHLYLNAPPAGRIGGDRDPAQDQPAFRLAASQLMNIGRINPDFLDGNSGIGALVGEMPEKLGAVVRGTSPKEVALCSGQTWPSSATIDIISGGVAEQVQYGGLNEPSAVSVGVLLGNPVWSNTAQRPSVGIKLLEHGLQLEPIL